MKGISRRTRACAAVAGMAIFASAATAQAQTRPEKVGDGIPTGQMSVQMFNYGTFISTGGNNTVPTVTGIKPAADGTQCNTSVTATDPAPLLLECRWNRVEALFAFLQKKGVTSIEAFGHQAFPTVNATTVGMIDPGMTIDVAALPPHATVFDCVYVPPETPLLAAARARGLAAANGSEMLIQQAAIAFERWTGVGGMADVMRAAVAPLLADPTVTA